MSNHMQQNGNLTQPEKSPQSDPRDGKNHNKIMAVSLVQKSVKMYSSHIDVLQGQVGQKEGQERFRSSEPMVYLEPRLATVTTLVPNSLH